MATMVIANFLLQLNKQSLVITETNCLFDSC